LSVVWKKLAYADVVTTSAPGLCPTLSNVVTEFLNGQGGFSTPAGGAQIKVKTETKDLSEASGDVSYTGYGFTPSQLLFYASDSLHTSVVGIGSSDASKNYTCIFGTASTSLGISSAYCIRQGTSTNYQTAIVKTYDADGFTLTWTKNSSPSGTSNILVVAFK
jgi:hypothetical protein